MLKKKIFFNNNAQGTIEYLVLIGIIVVIGLSVVFLATNFLDSANQISNTTGNIKSNLGQGGISIVEAITDIQGDSILILKNNTSEKLVLTSITPIDASGNAGTKENYNKTIHYNETITFSYPTNTSCVCSDTEETKTCNYEIELTSTHGLTKKERITITLNCVINSELNIISQAVAPILVDCYNATDDPIQICSLSDLNRIREDLTANYILMNDIDASETITWNDGSGWEPIGSCGPNEECYQSNYSYSFSGNLNGNNKIISNLFIYRPLQSDIGLFGYLSGNISNIGVMDQNITGNQNVGGFTGQLKGTITNSFTNGTIRSTASGLWVYAYAGGLVGYSGGLISNSYTQGNIYGENMLGGLVAYSYGNIINSYSTVNINSTGEMIGGLAGYLGFGKQITNSFATGNVSGSLDVGGLLGIKSSGTVTNSYWDTYLTNQTNCISDSNDGCTPTNNEITEYYGSLGVQKLGNDGNWTARDGDYPILSWQNE